MSIKAYMPRKQAQKMGHETVALLEDGRYTNPSGQIVSLAEDLEAMAQGTVEFPPDAPLPDVAVEGLQETQFEVTNETSLQAIERHVQEGRAVAALNFASAKSPGGGFLSGSRAQEESLARSSGLYWSLKEQPMYAFHKALRGGFYTNYAIHSPQVPIFRDDHGGLLPQPHHCGIITAPAVNARVVLRHNTASKAAIAAEMGARIAKVLHIAALHQYDTLVLGAWGCGAFGNDSADIAPLFYDALHSTFQGVFAQITFAIVDFSPERRFLGPFFQLFAPDPTLDVP